MAGSSRTLTPPPAFDVRAFLDSAGVARRKVTFTPPAVVFPQGGPANSVFYLEEGGVKLSVLSSTGREAVVAMLGMALATPATAQSVSLDTW